MERRKIERSARRVQIHFWTEEDDSPRTGYTINVSPTGMFVGTGRPLAPGTKVWVRVLGGEPPLDIEGVVVHAARVSPMLQRLRPSGMGIRFIHHQPDLLESLG